MKMKIENRLLSIEKFSDFDKRNIFIVAGLRMIHLATLFFCVYFLMHLNEGSNYNDVQQINSKDPSKEDRVEFYGSNDLYSDESGKKIWQLQAYFHTETNHGYNRNLF